MGQFKIEITAVGGHGVDREVKDGEVVNFYKEGTITPDALAKTLISVMKWHGIDVENAIITHWPGTESEVKDDLLTGIRKGNF